MDTPYWVELVGGVAGVLTTLAFLPQALKVYRTKSVHDISLPTFLMFTCGVSCWFVYGLFIQSISIAAANIITLAIALSILIMKLRYGARRRSLEER